MLLAEIFHKIYPVFLAGLVFGAGLPILYAVAVRLVSGTATETADGTVKVEVHPLARVAAYAIFVLLALAILFICQNGGWQGGCGGNCAGCHSKCAEAEKKPRK